MSTALQTPNEPKPASPPREKDEDPVSGSHRKLRPLPTPVRILLYFLGWLLIIVGLLGLVLPGIQGILTLALGAAALSLVSEATHRWLRSVLKPWPAGQRRMEQLRAKVHSWLSRD